jgi:hypothetical protein
MNKVDRDNSKWSIKNNNNSNAICDDLKKSSTGSPLEKLKSVSWEVGKGGKYIKASNKSPSSSGTKDSGRSCIENTAPKVKKSSNKTYPTWEFGKTKHFEKPRDNEKTREAAICVQRMVRGWWQRLQFRIQLLEFKLLHRDVLTRQAVKKVHERKELRKNMYNKKMKEVANKELAKVTDAEKCAYESQRIIQFLRKQNKKLREKNQKIYEASVNLKQENDRLEGVNWHTGDTVSQLSAYAKHIQETHDKLVHVIPKYQDSIFELQEGLDLRNQYCALEHKTKLLYLKCAGHVITKVEFCCRDADLVDEIVGYALQMDASDNPHELAGSSSDSINHSSDSSLSMSKVGFEHLPGDDNGDDNDDDSENYDEYAVASLSQSKANFQS